MDNSSNSEASKDPGIFIPRYTEQDYEGSSRLFILAYILYYVTPLGYTYVV